IKNIETWFSEQIEKELNIGDGGEKEVKVSVAIPPAMRNENISNSEVLTNNSIVELVKAGISEEIVVNMIKTQPTRFDVSVGEILALKTNGVSEKIINEIVLCGKGTSVASVTSPSGSVKLNDGAKVVVPMIPAPATTNIIISDPAVEKLCESLEQDNPGKVIDALKKLRNMKATEAAPKILPCLANSNPDVVREACRTLVVIGNQDAVPAIIPLLTNEKPDIIREACRTIAIIGNKDAIPAIEPLLTNSRSDIRDEAYKAITKLRAEQ
ncbi:MAG TPA: HEAT repeat domain-containing protein, partial [Sedimentisphaerales bacterium]